MGIGSQQRSAARGRTALARRLAQVRTGEEGMSTAEYAVGTVAACAFAAVLYQVQSFGTGQLDLRFIAMHLSVAAFMLYATVKVLESRRYQ